MSISVKEIAYIAGLFEGEGTFCMNNESPRIAIAMTDLDVIERAKAIIDKTKIISSHSEGESKDGYKRKTRYTFTVVGSLAIQWMMTIYPLMGLRRKAKIRELIYLWKVRGSGKEALANAKMLQILMKAKGLSIEEAEKILLEGLFTVKE